MKMNSPESIPVLEKFGLYIIQFFSKTKNIKTELPADHVLQRHVSKIIFWSVLASACIGVLCVYPIVKLDLYLKTESIYQHYLYLAIATLFLTIIEILILFIIAIFAVKKLSGLVPCNDNKPYLKYGPFAIDRILVRTALEINEPVVLLYGIDPFQQISKRNLLIRSLLYKLKIIISNLIIKWSLIIFLGEEIIGISVLYEAVLVEIFWNSVIIYRVIKDARLRIFGFYIANTITENSIPLSLLKNLSAQGKEACLRAVANTVVMTKNYHSNMMILLLEFDLQLQVKPNTKIDNWQAFLTQLQSLPEQEKNIVLDVLCIAIAFDGKLSDLEITHIEQAFGNYTNAYQQRIIQLIYSLSIGKINEAISMCAIDTTAG
jgi:hypothetical protein